MAGDITVDGTLEELFEFNGWLKGQPFDHKVVIAGNHDNWLADHRMEASGVLFNATYLDEEMVTIEGLRIYGSPYSPPSPSLAETPNVFQLERNSDALAMIWERIPASTDILITHCPPEGILDRELRLNGWTSRYGCALLAREVKKRIRPKLHVFGHIHGGHGVTSIDGTIYVNAATCRKVKDPTINVPIVVGI